MAGKLLLRGMLVGLVAGLLSFGFLKIFGEPQVDIAIAFEGQLDERKAQAKAAADKAAGVATPKEEPEPELVSRPVQSGIGLFTGVMVYSAAFGGLFSLVFAAMYGRAGRLGARPLSALMAAAGLFAIYVVPNLKYPANPPSVGEPETIRLRTALYFAMILVSLVGGIIALNLRGRLLRRLGAWDATLAAAATYLVVVALSATALPGVNEVPEQFPAVVLWHFRIASMGAQLIMWTTLGLGFGALVERGTVGAGRLRRLTPAL